MPVSTVHMVKFLIKVGGGGAHMASAKCEPIMGKIDKWPRSPSLKFIPKSQDAEEKS